MEIETKYLITLTDALKSFSDIKINKAREKIQSWEEDMLGNMLYDKENDEDDFLENSIFKDENYIRHDENIILFDGNVLSYQDLCDNLLVEGARGKLSITPQGAKYLIILYKNSIFELKSNPSSKIISEKLIDYSNSYELIIEKQKEDTFQLDQEKRELTKKLVFYNP